MKLKEILRIVKEIFESVAAHRSVTSNWGVQTVIRVKSKIVKCFTEGTECRRQQQQR